VLGSRSGERFYGEVGAVRKGFFVVLVAILYTFGFPSIALGGVWTLHAAGHGPNSRAQWKANVGEVDSDGIGHQALYMQKMNDSQSRGFAVAVIHGLAGQPVSAITSVSWDGPNPATNLNGSYCGVSPHWQISTKSPAGVKSSGGFGPCSAQMHTASTTTPLTWRRDTCSIANGCLAGLDPTAIISSLAIVYEDGNDVNAQGYILLDNITVVTSTMGSHTWTSNQDNASASIQMGASIALADDVTDVLNDLLDMFPSVPATDWTFYPAVDLLPLP
jgi:hypothetical protein